MVNVKALRKILKGSPEEKAKAASKALGSGYASKAVGAINKRKKAQAAELKKMGY